MVGHVSGTPRPIRTSLAFRVLKPRRHLPFDNANVLAVATRYATTGSKCRPDWTRSFIKDISISSDEERFPSGPVRMGPSSPSFNCRYPPIQPSQLILAIVFKAASVCQCLPWAESLIFARNFLSFWHNLVCWLQLEHIAFTLYIKGHRCDRWDIPDLAVCQSQHVRFHTEKWLPTPTRVIWESTDLSLYNPTNQCFFHGSPRLSP